MDVPIPGGTVSWSYFVSVMIFAVTLTVAVIVAGVWGPLAGVLVLLAPAVVWVVVGGLAGSDKRWMP